MCQNHLLERKLFFLPYLSSTRLGLMDLMKQNKQFELISARLNSGFACRKSSTNQSTTMATPTQQNTFDNTFARILLMNKCNLSYELVIAGFGITILATRQT